MLKMLDDAIEVFLRAAVPLPEDTTDVSFAAPDRDWAMARSKQRQTVNVFLWDVRRNLAEQDSGLHRRTGADGETIRTSPLPIVDCRYLLTVWAGDPTASDEHARDEHDLLGRILQALLSSPMLPGAVVGHTDVTSFLARLTVSLPDGKDTMDFWSALGGQLRPGLDLVITTTVDAVLSQPAGPRVSDFSLIVRSLRGPFAGGEEVVTWGSDDP